MQYEYAVQYMYVTVSVCLCGLVDKQQTLVECTA